jgi:preprotein translocase subunit SecE
MKAIEQLQVFFREVYVELSRVVWPTRNEVIGSLLVVLVLIVAFSLYIGSIDFVFYRIAQQIF